MHCCLVTMNIINAKMIASISALLSVDLVVITTLSGYTEKMNTHRFCLVYGLWFSNIADKMFGSAQTYFQYDRAIDIPI